jgi:hypothetical protein
MHQPPLTQALREVAPVDINSVVEFAVPALSSELAGASSLIKSLNDRTSSVDPLPELVYVRAELCANADRVASDSVDDVFMVDSDETPPDESVPDSVQKSTEAPPLVPTGFGSAGTSVVIALGLDPTASRRAPFVPLPPFKSSRSTFNAKKRAYAQVLAVVNAEVTAAQNLEVSNDDHDMLCNCDLALHFYLIAFIFPSRRRSGQPSVVHRRLPNVEPASRLSRSQSTNGWPDNRCQSNWTGSVWPSSAVA